MKKSKVIAQAIGLTYLQYENCRDAHFGLWCNKYSAQVSVPLRKLQLNDFVFNWFCEMWQRKVELPFYMDFQPYLEGDINEACRMQDLFLEYTDGVLPYYPKPLLNSIKNEFKNSFLHG